jgi:hypothetical protein
MLREDTHIFFRTRHRKVIREIESNTPYYLLPHHYPTVDEVAALTDRNWRGEHVEHLSTILGGEPEREE